MNKPTKFRGRKKSSVLLTLVGGAVVVVLVLVGFLISTKSKESKSNIIKVGQYHYIDACRLLPLDKYEAVFGMPAAEGTIVENTFRESLPAAGGDWFSSTSCELALASGDSAAKGGDVSWQLYQYQTDKEAERQFSEQNFDSATPVVGVADAYTRYNELVGTTYTYKLRNVIVNVSYKPAQVEAALRSEQASEMAKKLIASSQTKLADSQLEQRPFLGDGIDPCTIFTAEDYKLVTGVEADDEAITLSYALPQAATLKNVDRFDLELALPACNRHEKALDDPLFEYGSGKISKQEYEKRKATFEEKLFWDGTVRAARYENEAAASRAADDIVSLLGSNVTITDIPGVGSKAVIVRSSSWANKSGSAVVITKGEAVVWIHVAKNQQNAFSLRSDYEQATDAQYIGLAKRVSERL